MVSEAGEVLRQTKPNDTEGKVAVKNCFSIGLGSIYGADHIAIGGESDAHEKGADGVNLYIGALGTHVRNRIWPDVFKEEIEKEENEIERARCEGTRYQRGGRKYRSYRKLTFFFTFCVCVWLFQLKLVVLNDTQSSSEYSISQSY